MPTAETAQTHVAMTGVAWWTCALLALVSARIYERCELAQELQRLNVQQDHIATWVCIAFHESRFDTAAQNPSSGDHGLLQISELYWCGNGKVCGVPCSAFRDDDISDDVDCALQIYEEHTRLQGDGFLAWVVYAQHCKHNTKKYLADCEVTPKNVTAKTMSKQRALSGNSLNITNVLKTNIDDLKPPYLTIGSVISGSYANELEQNYNHKSVDRKNWIDYKIDNIDDLTLPVFKNSQPFNSGPIQTTTTTWPLSVIPNRVIETDQFRNRASSIPLLNKKESNPINSAPSVTTTVPPSAFQRRVLKGNQLPDRSSSKITLTPTSKSYIKTYTTPRTTTYKPLTTQSTTPYYKAEKKIFTFPARTHATHNKLPTTTTQTPRPVNSLQYSSYVTSAKQTTLKTKNFTSNRFVAPSTTTPRITTRQTTHTPRTTITTSTTRSTSASSQRTTKHWNKAKPFTFANTIPTTSRTTVTGESVVQATKKPFSIFDFYLNPTKRPMLPPYSVPTFDSRYKLTIFSDGTTPVPIFSKKKTI